MFKRTLQVIFGLALVVQLTGCFYRDDRWHHDHDNYHEHDHGPDVIIRP